MLGLAVFGLCHMGCESASAVAMWPCGLPEAARAVTRAHLVSLACLGLLAAALAARRWRWSWRIHGPIGRRGGGGGRGEGSDARSMTLAF
eukprot:scaffold3384_cov27-Tisochrysis_lutea.AAC.5